MIVEAVLALELGGTSVSFRHNEMALACGIERIGVERAAKYIAAGAPENVEVADVTCDDEGALASHDADDLVGGYSLAHQGAWLNGLLVRPQIIESPVAKLADGRFFWVGAPTSNDHHPNSDAPSRCLPPISHRDPDFWALPCMKSGGLHFVYAQIGSQLALGRETIHLDRFIGRLGRGGRFPDGLSGQVEAVKQPNQSERRQNGLPFRPLGSSSRTVGSLPLGAKIGLSVILAWIAWALVFVGFDRLDSFRSGSRYRLQGVLYFGAGCALLLLAGTQWG